MKNLVFAVFLGLFATHAQAVLIGFDSISNSGNYTEDGFNFVATGGSTDGSDTLLWSNGGGSGNNDILVSAEGGTAFDATSVDVLAIFGNHLRIFDQDGNLLVDSNALVEDETNPLDITGVTGLRLETNGNGAEIDNLELTAIPAPATVGLLLLGLMGVCRAHRTARA